VKTIKTAYDARKEKFYADLNREAAIERRELRAKVRKWERKVALYGGQAHIDTLTRFKARLAEI
jgi:hypothetical protein